MLHWNRSERKTHNHFLTPFGVSCQNPVLAFLKASSVLKLMCWWHQSRGWYGWWNKLHFIRRLMCYYGGGISSPLSKFPFRSQNEPRIEKDTSNYFIRHVSLWLFGIKRKQLGYSGSSHCGDSHAHKIYKPYFL